jgi:hypothetical protein
MCFATGLFLDGFALLESGHGTCTNSHLAIPNQTVLFVGLLKGKSQDECLALWNQAAAAVAAYWHAYIWQLAASTL